VFLNLESGKSAYIEQISRESGQYSTAGNTKQSPGNNELPGLVLGFVWVSYSVLSAALLVPVCPSTLRNYLILFGQFTTYQFSRETQGKWGALSGFDYP